MNTALTITTTLLFTFYTFSIYFYFNQSIVNLKFHDFLIIEFFRSLHHLIPIIVSLFIIVDSYDSTIITKIRHPDLFSETIKVHLTKTIPINKYRINVLKRKRVITCRKIDILIKLVKSKLNQGVCYRKINFLKDFILSPNHIEQSYHESNINKMANLLSRTYVQKFHTVHDDYVSLKKDILFKLKHHDIRIRSEARTKTQELLRFLQTQEGYCFLKFFNLRTLTNNELSRIVMIRPYPSLIFLKNFISPNNNNIHKNRGIRSRKLNQIQIQFSGKQIKPISNKSTFKYDLYHVTNFFDPFNLKLTLFNNFNQFFYRHVNPNNKCLHGKVNMNIRNRLHSCFGGKDEITGAGNIKNRRNWYKVDQIKINLKEKRQPDWEYMNVTRPTTDEVNWVNPFKITYERPIIDIGKWQTAESILFNLSRRYPNLDTVSYNNIIDYVNHQQHRCVFSFDEDNFTFRWMPYETYVNNYLDYKQSKETSIETNLLNLDQEDIQNLIDIENDVTSKTEEERLKNQNITNRSISDITAHLVTKDMIRDIKQKLRGLHVYDDAQNHYEEIKEYMNAENYRKLIKNYMNYNLQYWKKTGPLEIKEWLFIGSDEENSPNAFKEMREALVYFHDVPNQLRPIGKEVNTWSTMDLFDQNYSILTCPECGNLEFITDSGPDKHSWHACSYGHEIAVGDHIYKPETNFLKIHPEGYGRTFSSKPATIREVSLDQRNYNEQHPQHAGRPLVIDENPEYVKIYSLQSTQTRYYCRMEKLPESITNVKNTIEWPTPLLGWGVFAQLLEHWNEHNSTNYKVEDFQ